MFKVTEISNQEGQYTYIYGFRVQSDQFGVRTILHSYKVKLGDKDGKTLTHYNEFSGKLNSIKREDIIVPAGVSMEFFNKMKDSLFVQE